MLALRPSIGPNCCGIRCHTARAVRSGFSQVLDFRLHATTPHRCSIAGQATRNGPFMRAAAAPQFELVSGAKTATVIL